MWLMVKCAVCNWLTIILGLAAFWLVLDVSNIKGMGVGSVIRACLGLADTVTFSFFAAMTINWTREYHDRYLDARRSMKMGRLRFPVLPCPQTGYILSWFTHRR